MTQKRRPILLITLMATIFLIVAGLNLTNVLGDKKVLQSIESPNKEALDKMLKRSNTAVPKESSSLGKLRDAGKSQGVNASVRAGTRGEVPQIPSIEVPGRGLLLKPEYKTNRTSGQWYSQDAYDKKTAGTKN